MAARTNDRAPLLALIVAGLFTLLLFRISGAPPLRVPIPSSGKQQALAPDQREKDNWQTKKPSLKPEQISD